MSLAETIRAHLPRKTLDVPALGGTIEIVGMTARDMSAVMKGPDGAEGNALMLARSLYKDGQRIVADGGEGELLDLPHAVFSMLVKEAADLNLIGKGAAESAKKNSAATTEDGSSSA